MGILLVSLVAKGVLGKVIPCPPLLFCLAEDALSRGIYFLVKSGDLKLMSGPRAYFTHSHVMYADDVMVFCKGTKKNLSNLMALFHQYGCASGQFLSLDKCRFYPGGLSAVRIAQIASFLGFQAGRMPFIYLGVPIFQGKPKSSYLKPIVDRIKTKLASWKGVMLSIMGRIQLVKSIIHGILVYSFHVYAWPKSLLKQLDTWIRSFIWSGDIYTRKLVTVSWEKLCCSFEEGGIGLRSLRAINEAAMLKLS